MIKKILNAIKNFFVLPIHYGLGSLESPEDRRTISTAAVQVPVQLPDDFNSTTSPVDLQDADDCVGEAIKGIKEDFLLDSGNFVALSADDLYEQAKIIDGVPNTPGTYPLVGAKVATSTGISSKTVYDSGDKLAIAADRAKYKLGGFMSVNNDFQSVCQAIFQNKRITVAFSVDNNWFLGIIGKVLQSIGRHYTKLHGFNVTAQIVRGQNSWGISWIGKVAGFVDPKLAPGHFNVYWPDVKDSVSDILAFTDSIPAPIIEHVQSINYHFNTAMQSGQQSYDVIQLQKRLAQEGFWPSGQSFTGFYGAITATQVLALQIAKGIIKDASASAAGHYCGAKTLNWLNGEVGLDIMHAQIQVESEGNDYAIGDLGLVNHAYGCLQIRQGVCDDVNAKCGTRHKAADMLGNRALSTEVWTKYFTVVYPQFDTPEKKAKAWNGGPGFAAIEALASKTPAQYKYVYNINYYWSKVSAMLA